MHVHTKYDAYIKMPIDSYIHAIMLLMSLTGIWAVQILANVLGNFWCECTGAHLNKAIVDTGSNSANHYVDSIAVIALGSVLK